ncbi:MAG: hypothetical protein J6X28_01560 [Bacilli bacterium]|nr:hypothetical protein [Bacilli bacterium]
MSKKNIKYILFLLFLIIVLFFCGVCFIIIVKDSMNQDNQPVKDNDVVLMAEDKTITIKNIISVSEDFGKKIDEDNNGAFGYVKFDVVNKTTYDRGYQIYITKQEPSVKEINPSYMTFYLTDLSDEPMKGYLGNKLPSYDDFKYISDKADSKSIHTGIIKGGETLHFVLRVWITDNYAVMKEEENFVFTIGARAV